jgi:inhibitor of cysteine peptidase
MLVLCIALVLNSSVVPSFAAEKGAASKVTVTKVVPGQKPTPAKPVDQSITVQGTVQVSMVQSRKLTLVTEKKELYNLIGATAGLEKYAGKKVAVTGVIKEAAKSVGERGINFQVKSFKALPEASVKPVATPAPTKIEVQGTLYNLNSDKYGFYIVSEKGNYILRGNTAGMEKVCGSQIYVKGEYQADPAGEFSGIINVIEYKVISTPTPVVDPTPVKDKIAGTIKVIKSETGLSFSLVTTDISYSLTGNTKGMESLDGAQVVVYGTHSILTIYPPIFIVESYSVISIPSAPTTPVVTPVIVLRGTLDVTKYEDPSANIGVSYKISLKSQDGGLYTLNGKIDGMEKYNGYTAEVVGTVSPLKIYPPIFIVESYKIIVEPSVTPNYDVLQGTLKVVENTYADSLVPQYKYLLGTKGGVFELIGNTAGLEKYNGMEVEVKGSYVMTLVATEYPLFSVVSYRLVSQPTPTPEYDVLQGTLKVVENTYADSLVPQYKYLLGTKGGVFELIGNTAGLEKYNGMEVEVKGSYVMKLLAAEYPLFSVVSYRLVSQPTPTPDYDVLQGTLKVVENIYAGSVVPQYKYLLGTKGGVFELIGNTAGLEKYNGMEVEVKGSYVMTLVATEYPLFSVVSYRLVSQPTPTPEYDVLQGALKVVEIIAPESSKLAYQYLLSTKNGVYQLIGNTKGLEKYNGMEIEVKGHYVMTILPILPTERPLFNVVSYSLVKPVPTSTPSGMAHNVISEKPLYSWGPVDGDVKVLDGKCMISWMEGTYNAVFKAKLTVLKDKQKADYEYELVAVKTSDKESITGLFNIKKDGVVIAKQIYGKLYGLDGSVGDYFKFYSDDTKWHMSAYITSRLDF